MGQPEATLLQPRREENKIAANKKSSVKN